MQCFENQLDMRLRKTDGINQAANQNIQGIEENTLDVAGHTTLFLHVNVNLISRKSARGH